MTKIKANEVLKLVISLLICQLAGIIGSFFTRPSIPTWYATLGKPLFTPPNWLFAPVWVALFAMMGVSLFLVVRKNLKNAQVKLALGIFGVQLILNIVWSMVFFGLRSPLAGFIEIIVLWIAILLTIIYFSKLSRAAGLLLIPYFLWVSFAAILNFSIWRINM